MAAEETAPASDPGLEALTDDYFETDTTEAAASEQPKDSTEPTAETTQTQPATEQSADAPTAPAGEPEPAEKTWSYQGKQYTYKQLVDGGLLDAIVTSAQQMPHFQRLYEEQLKRAAQQQAQQQQPQQAPQGQQPRGISPAQLQAHYQPTIEGLVKAGHIEEDLATAFPAAISNIVFAVDQLADARQAIQILTDRLNTAERGSTEQTVIREIDNSIASLAQTGEHFAPLADPQERQGFFNYLVQINPQVGLLRNPQFLQSQWFAYKKDVWAGQASELQQLRAAQAAATQNTRRLARADGSGTRPGAAAPPEEQFGNDMLDEEAFPALFANRR